MIELILYKIRQHLTSTIENINVWFDKPDELRNHKPLDDGWTINEILEHISLTSHFLLKLIDKGGEKALRQAKKLMSKIC